MFANFGYLFVAIAFGWAAFFLLRNAKGAVWMHFVAAGVALLGGLGLIGTAADGMIDWTATAFVSGGAAIIFIVLIVFVIRDFKDKKPDAVTLVAMLVLPSIIVVGFSQARTFVGDAIDKAPNIRAVTEQSSGR
jgi:hypothetical protein